MICPRGRHGGLALSVIRRGERMVLCATCGRMVAEKAKGFTLGQYVPAGSERGA